MASIRKTGKKWLAEVRTKKAYKSRTFQTKSEAQTWAMEYEQMLGKHKGAPIYHSLGEAMEKYAKEVSPTKKGARWEIIRLEKLRRDEIANLAISDITHEDIEEWIGRQNISPASINRELNVIAAVLKTARLRWKWVSADPMKDVEKPKSPPPRDRIISDSELQRILLALEYQEGEPVTTARQEIAVAVLFALETAMRQGEIWGLEWDRVHLDRCYVHLPETKNGTKRDVPLSKRAVELLRKLGERQQGRVFTRCSQQTAGVMYRRAVHLAGVDNLTFHDTRHTAITRLARKLDVLDLARMVGHRDVRSLMIYYNATAEEIAKRL